MSTVAKNLEEWYTILENVIQRNQNYIDELESIMIDSNSSI